VAILDISKTMAPREKPTADLDSQKSLTKSRYLDNGATLGYIRAIWWPFWISQTMVPRKKLTADLDSRKNLTKSRYLDNGAALGYLRAIWWPFWISQKLWLLGKN
jgi:hypothetical protein